MSVAAGGRSDAKKKILIVEDDPDQLMVRVLLLEGQGFSCATAADADTALRAFQQEQPDCVLMDLNIPAEGDGVQLIQRLESLPQPPPVVILTGSRVARLRTRPVLKQVAAFVEKGSPARELIRTLQDICGCARFGPEELN